MTTTKHKYRQLVLGTSMDTKYTFRVAVKNYKGLMTHVDCSLRCGYDKVDDGIYWGLNGGTMIASSYSADEIAERKRLASEPHLQDGETVEIDGDLYIARVKGQYSNAVIFEPVAA